MDKLPRILVFLSEGRPLPQEEEIVKIFTAKGIVPMVDKVHKDNENWMKANFGNTPHQFFEGYGFPQEDNIVFDGHEDPDFVIYFSDHIVLDEYEWSCIKAYVAFIFDVKHIDFEALKKAEELMQIVKPEMIAGSLPMIREEKEINEFYDFHSVYFEKRDTKLYQVDTCVRSEVANLKG